MHTAVVLHPAIFYFFLGLEIVLMHLAQALIFFPLAETTHWRLGYFLFLAAGLYLPRSLFRGVKSIEPLPQVSHSLDIYLKFLISNF